MKLTGGTARGTKLFSVAGVDVRPALARMRISVFEILKPSLDGARVLDLFAGTGCLGLEALSRGAAHAVFLDIDDRCIETLHRNLAKLKFAARAEVVRGSAFEASRIAGGPFDLVFVDPPYAFYDERAAEVEGAVAALRPRLSPAALVLAEHRTVQRLPEKWAGLTRSDERGYGGTTVTFYGAR
jgi:16S rRNA (guanine966-N2)-methyltransferase